MVPVTFPVPFKHMTYQENILKMAEQFARQNEPALFDSIKNWPNSELAQEMKDNAIHRYTDQAELAIHFAYVIASPLVMQWAVDTYKKKDQIYHYNKRCEAMGLIRLDNIKGWGDADVIYENCQCMQCIVQRSQKERTMSNFEKAINDAAISTPTMTEDEKDEEVRQILDATELAGKRRNEQLERFSRVMAEAGYVTHIEGWKIQIEFALYKNAISFMDEYKDQFPDISFSWRKDKPDGKSRMQYFVTVSTLCL